MGGFQNMGGELAAVDCGPKLGRGPVGTSYEGRRQGQPVVVKVLSRRFAQHEGLIDRLMNDAKAFLGYKHASLAALLQAGSTEGRHVLVFEKARGRPLDQVLAEKGPLAPSAALRVIYDVAQVLADAPKPCGDVRAEKVFFDGQRAQVVDLGLARASSLGAGHGAHGLPFGDPRYLAPEVMQEEQAEPQPAGDVYALGVLLYQLVCGKLPFVGDPQEVLGKHLESPLPPPPKNVSFSTKIAALILRMTAKSPSQRIPDPKTVVDVITQLLEGKPLSLPPIPSDAGGAQSSVEVDEFDPNELSMDEGDISADKWEATSKPMARHGSGEWDRNKIAAARGKGPQIEAMASDDALSPMAAAIAEATGERPTSSRRMRVGKSGRVANSATSSKRSTRQTGVSERPRRKQGTDKRGLLKAVGGIVLVCGVMLGIALIPDPEPEPIINQETGEVWAAPAPPPLEAVKDLEASAKQVAAQLEEYGRKVDGKIEERAFNEALALSQDLPADLRNSQQGAAAIQLAETRIRDAARVETAAFTKRIRELIETGQFELAEREAKRMEGWVIEPKIVQVLLDESKDAFLDRHRGVNDLEVTGNFDHRQADRWLRTNLKSANWGRRSKLYPKGGLLLEYAQLRREAADELTMLHHDRLGALPQLVSAGRAGTALKIVGEERQGLLIVPIKWQSVLDASVEFVVSAKVEPDTQADLAICMGVDHRGRSGAGLSWGKFPVTLKPGRTERSSLPGVQVQNFQSQAPYRLQLSAATGAGQTVYSGALTNLAKKSVQEGQFTAPGSTAGYVAIVAQGVDVGVLSIEVRGVPEPTQFKPKQ